MIKTCEWCGEEFETNSHSSKYCNNDHYATCVVCGKPYIVSREYLGVKDRPRTCSKACRSILRKQTNLKKYGGTAPIHSAQIKAKIDKTNLERYRDIYPSRTDKCKEKSKATSLEKYGVDHYAKQEHVKEELSRRLKNLSDSSKEKRRQTLIERYGVDNPFKSGELREKAKATYKAKTGYEHASQNPQVQYQIEQTSYDKYGTRRPQMNSAVKNKIKKSLNEIFDNEMRRSEVLAKRRISCINRYGVDNPMKDDSVKLSFTNSMLKSYGKPYASQTTSWRKSVISDPSKIEIFESFKDDPSTFIETRFCKKPTLRELCQDIGVSDTTGVTHTLIRHNCQDKVAYVFSYMENDVYDVIKKIDDDIKIIRNDRTQIKPYELDLYLPDFNLAIECNPTATHNSSINVFDPLSLPLSPSYHKKKTDMCDEEGIFLFHIYGYEWEHKRYIIISMLKNLLGRNESKIGARKCVVKDVDSKSARTFLNGNHRQGYAPAAIRFGLYYNDELVSLMTFSKPRHTIGTNTKVDNPREYELVRFCNKVNITVNGGASRLFNYFVKEYSPHKIISFSDRSHTKGNLYEVLGFKCDHISSPNYVWVNTNTDIAYNRVNAQKRNISKFLKDENIDLAKSESTIMEEHGFVSVYDSGTKVWVWTDNSEVQK